MSKSYYFRIGFCIVLGVLFGAFGVMILKDFIIYSKHVLFTSSDLLPFAFMLLTFFVSLAMFFAAWKYWKIKGQVELEGPAILFRRWF